MIEPKRKILFQEYLKSEPFWMLVACQLVNMTSFDQAEHVLSRLRSEYTIDTLASARDEDLHEMLRPLGLWRRRSRSLIAMAQVWVIDPPKHAKDVLRLPGCGKYASDSWSIFVDGNLCVEPEDGKLNWYLERIKGNG